jgi:hypothetical protein
MKRIKMMFYFYWVVALYFSIRIILARAAFHQQEHEFVFHIMGFWSCLVLAFLFLIGWKLVEGVSTCIGKEHYYMLLPLIVLPIVTSLIYIFQSQGGQYSIFMITATCAGIIVMTVTVGAVRIVKSLRAK